MSHKTLNLDLSKTPILKPIIYGRIGDEDMQTVTVNITSRDSPVDLTDFTITFEGITSGGQTKVFDVDGISSTEAGLKTGTFDYTFPNMAFAVAGNYEIAYFSIVKGDKRDTTGEFDIIVDGNADIDAPLAETIITEYNQLVTTLHQTTDKYISDSDAKFADLNQQIADLQSKITEYQTTIQNTADTAVSAINTTKDTAVSTVNTAASSAVKTINDALEEFKAGDFYTKAEADAKFATIQSLTDLSTTVEGKADDSAVVHNAGDETIAGTKTFEDIKVTGDIPWTDISPINGFSLTPSTGGKGTLKYKIQQGVLYVSARGVVLPALPLETPTAFVKLPFAVPQNATAAFTGPNLSSSLYAKEVCTLQSNGGDGAIYYAKSTATTAGDRFSGMFIVPTE